MPPPISLTSLASVHTSCEYSRAEDKFKVPNTEVTNLSPLSLACRLSASMPFGVCTPGLSFKVLAAFVAVGALFAFVVYVVVSIIVAVAGARSTTTVLTTPTTPATAAAGGHAGHAGARPGGGRRYGGADCPICLDRPAENAVFTNCGHTVCGQCFMNLCRRYVRTTCIACTGADRRLSVCIHVCAL